MKRVAAILAIVLVALGVAAYASYANYMAYLDTPLALGESPVRYEIAPGASLGAVALDLGERGWLARPHWFVWHARARGDAQRVRAGEYRIRAGTTARELLDLFISGDVVQHAFTIIEGSTFADVRRSLAASEKIEQRTAGYDDAKIMAELGRPGVSPEGRFLPETYYYTKGTTDLELLRRAMALMDKTLAGLWASRPADSVLKEPVEALVLASIIEKETGLDSEREKISGVFTRRLRQGMRLQSDPTVIYGMGAAYDGNIRRKDLRSDTPYNTYTRNGLPPTPIAMPGRASIEAALHPADGTALFFVATGEPDGSHHFSTTLEEHNRAVQRYLARLRQRP